MAISDTNLDTSVFTAVRTIVVAAAPYVQNSTTAATTAASINATYNDKTPTRPQIIVNPARINESDWTFNNTEGMKTINVVIECYYSDTLGMDQLFEQTSAALKANPLDGAELIGIVSDYDVSYPGETKYHAKTGTFMYRRE